MSILLNSTFTACVLRRPFHPHKLIMQKVERGDKKSTSALRSPKGEVRPGRWRLFITALHRPVELIYKFS